MSAHTPVPWYRPILVKGAPIQIEMAGHRMGRTITIAILGEGEEAEANADFIIRACNSHDELLICAHATLALPAVAKALAQYDACKFCDVATRDAGLLARAAIAKAKGQS